MASCRNWYGIYFSTKGPRNVHAPVNGPTPSARILEVLERVIPDIHLETKPLIRMVEERVRRLRSEIEEATAHSATPEPSVPMYR